MLFMMLPSFYTTMDIHL